MTFPSNLWILLIGCSYLVLCVNAVIENCPFEDTVDLTNIRAFPNGSYLYENTIIPSHQVSIYDYEEIFDGERLPRLPHPRGCVCQERKCIRFCCHPTKELIENQSRKCSPTTVDKDLEYDAYINVILEDGSIARRHATKEFTVVQGVPCEGTYPLIPQMDEDDGWDIFENGTILRHYDGAYVSKRDYCLIPMELESGEWVLNPMNCPILVPASLSVQINNIGEYSRENVFLNKICLRQSIL